MKTRKKIVGQGRSQGEKVQEFHFFIYKQNNHLKCEEQCTILNLTYFVQYKIQKLKVSSDSKYYFHLPSEFFGKR